MIKAQRDIEDFELLGARPWHDSARWGARRRSKRSGKLGRMICLKAS